MITKVLGRKIYLRSDVQVIERSLTQWFRISRGLDKRLLDRVTAI